MKISTTGSARIIITTLANFGKFQCKMVQCIYIRTIRYTIDNIAPLDLTMPINCRDSSNLCISYNLNFTNSAWRKGQASGVNSCYRSETDILILPCVINHTKAPYTLISYRQFQPVQWLTASNFMYLRQ